MSEQSEALKERTMTFAKCAPSVGANYRASCNARSRAEFIARLGVVVEESDESAFWLEVVHRMHIVETEHVSALLREAVEFRAIFSRSVGTARANVRSQRAAK